MAVGLQDVDVVIVGAGSAGLSAAKAAAERGLTFVLVEASHRIGGRAYTETFAPGIPYDLGCHWMHSASLNPFVAIADSLGFSYRRDSQWRSNIFTGGAFLPEDERQRWMDGMDADHAAIEAAAAEGRDVAVADVIDLSAPWAPFMAYWFSLGTSRDIDQVSVLDVTSYNDTEENWPLREGFGALVARWAADVPVTLNARAERITWSGKGVRVETARGTVTGRTALITVSTNVLTSGAIAFDPVLPAWKLEAAAALPLGVHNRIGIMLKDNPFPPDAPSNATVQIGDADEVPMSIQIRPFGMNYVSGVTGGRHGSWLERAGVAASIDHLTERLVAACGSGIRASLSDRTIVTAWESDPWTLGSYSGALPGHGDKRAELSRPVDDILFFAGEATSTEFFSTCHGAYLTGIAQIETIASRLKAAA
jgi:monoamine oxidase